MRKTALPKEQIPETLTRWCGHLGLNIQAAFAPSGDEALFPNRLVLEGPDGGYLSANKGQALDALQFLRLFRMKEIVAMAGFAAEKAKAFGTYTFSSLSPRERRWIHMVLSRQPGFTTQSEGTGTYKSLTVTRT